MRTKLFQCTSACVLLLCLCAARADIVNRDAFRVLFEDGNQNGPPQLCDAMQHYDKTTHTFYVFGGEDNNEEFSANLWTLAANATNSTNYVWKQFVYDSNSAVPAIRSSAATLLSSSYHRLYVYSGYTTNNVYCNDSWYLDLSTQTWHPLTASSQTPSPRAWSQIEWTNRSETVAILHGGLSQDGVDVNDTWIYTAASDSWVELDQTVRTVLDPYSNSLVLSHFPPRTEGHRMARVGNTLFVYGGYKCTEGGVVSVGGTTCFNNDVRMLHLNYTDYSQSYWTVRAKNDSDSIWPNPRYYHALAAYNRKLYVWGGSFIDLTSIQSFSNDLHVFNTVTLQWEPVLLTGLSPSIRYSHLSTLVGSELGVPEMWTFGGCTPTNHFNDLWALKPDVFLAAVNVSVTHGYNQGPGLSTVTAGALNWFTAQVVDGAGAPVTWGSGLSLEALITGSTVGGIPTIVPGEVTDYGAGFYNITYSVTESGGSVSVCGSRSSGAGRIQVFLRLFSVNVPGSPFIVTVLPSEISPNHTVASGVGIQQAVRDKNTSFTVTCGDLFGNQAVSGGNGGRLSVHFESGQAPADLNIVDMHDGSYGISFTTPEVAQYRLFVMLDGANIIGSPFLVSTIANLDISEGIHVAVIVIASICAASLFVYILLLFGLRSHPAVKAASVKFFSIMLLGCVLGLVSTYMPPTPADTSCMAFAWLLGPAYVVALFTLLVKNYRVAEIFATKALKITVKSDWHLIVMVLIALSLEILFFLIWTVVDPLVATETSSSGNPLVTYTICDCEHAPVWYGVTFGSKALLLFCCIYVAVISRNLPSMFNESRHISIAVYNIGLCSLVGLPLVMSLQDAPATVYLIKNLLIIWCIVVTASVLVVPKLIWVQETTNIRESFHLAQPKRSKDVEKSRSQEDRGSELFTVSPRPGNTSNLPRTVERRDSKSSRSISAGNLPRLASAALQDPPPPPSPAAQFLQVPGVAQPFHQPLAPASGETLPHPASDPLHPSQFIGVIAPVPLPTIHSDSGSIVASESTESALNLNKPHAQRPISASAITTHPQAVPEGLELTPSNDN